MSVLNYPTLSTFRYTVTRVSDSVVIDTFDLAPGENMDFTDLTPGDYDIAQTKIPIINGDGDPVLATYSVYSSDIEPDSAEVDITSAVLTYTIRVTVPDYTATAVEVETTFVNMYSQTVVD